MHSAGARAKCSALAASLCMAGGAGVVTYGIVADDLARSLGGGFVALIAAMLFGLAKIRSWTHDSRSEREGLARAQQDAQDARTRYEAASGALMQEKARTLRDLDAERVAIEYLLAAERKAMLEELKAAKAALAAEFEAKRERLIIDSLRTGIELHLKGLLQAPAAEPGEAAVVLDLFPQQPTRERTTHPADPVQEPEVVRDREAGLP